MPESPRSLSSSSAERGAVWFYARNKQKLGPLFWEEFRNLAATGQLKPEDMVFQQGTQRWQPASAVPDLFPPPPTSLKKFMGQTMAAGHAARIALGLSRALHALHQKNILHHKLTPEHILLTAEGEPKLTGFDAARPLTVETDLPPLESAVGTLAYMAPEHARSEKAVEEELTFKVVPLRVKGKFAGSKTEPPRFRVVQAAPEAAEPETLEESR